MTHWTTSDIPYLGGRTAVVTGTGGLGFEDALALARAGAEVIIAGRNPAKGAEAVAKVLADTPLAHVRFEAVDLASLASVAAFAERLKGQMDGLDILINNAGVMRPPQRLETEDGFEIQLGVNYLSHFALTARLMPLLTKGDRARVVTLSSIAARHGAMDFDDLNARRTYDPMPVYARSKLACLMFALELQRRSEAAGWGVTSLAAHPGLARTDLLHNAPGRGSPVGRLRSLLWFMFQPAAQGALPTLFAATAPGAEGGGYYGPDGLAEVRGHPGPSRIPPAAADRTDTARLWEVSEGLVDLSFGTPA